MKHSKPNLNKNITVKELNSWYWYKKDFTEFCRLHKLKTTGKKLELQKRIECFLKTGNAPLDNKNHESKSKNII